MKRAHCGSVCARRIDDTVARITADRLSGTWGQQVVIENKPGAGTMTATDYDSYRTLEEAVAALEDLYATGEVLPSAQPRIAWDRLRCGDQLWQTFPSLVPWLNLTQIKAGLNGFNRP
jgi:Tripartite tricarboxylate transporter family receptor